MSKKELDEELENQWIENDYNWCQLGIDLKSRRVDLTMEVSELMSAIVIRALLKMTEMSHDPIEIYLSTYGGDAYAGFAIYDAIRACPCDVSIFVSGKVMSAGVIIFLAGDIRVASPNARFMIHGVSSETGGKVKDMAVDINEAKFLDVRMLSIFTERSKMRNIKFWQKKMAMHDVYFGTEEARLYGFIKETIAEPKKGLTKKKETVKIKKPGKSKNVGKKSKS